MSERTDHAGVGRRRLLLGATAGAVAMAAEALAGPAHAASGTSDRRAKAPSQPFALGRREFSFKRGSRQLNTSVWYPATGTAGGDPVPNAPVAAGTFPVVAFSHGFNGLPEDYVPEIEPLAAAGFVVPAPVFPTTSKGNATDLTDVLNGNQSLDVSQVLTDILALGSDSGDPFYKHLDSSNGLGAAGHSAGAMTTQGLLGKERDERITGVAMLATSSIGQPTGTTATKCLFIHGDQDTVVPYRMGRRAYDEITWPKAFLTMVGQGHTDYLSPSGATYPQSRDTIVDWMRWSLYADTAACDRLPADATAPGTTWESANY